MAQKRSGAARQSDFPIFEYLNMLVPTRLWHDFMAMPRHQRGLVISIIASMILSLVIVGFGRAAINHYLATRGFFLYDALQSPYKIEERAVPLVPSEPNTLILPAAVGSYEWQIPLTDEQIEAAASAEIDALQVMMTTAQQALSNYEVAAAPVAAAPTEAIVSEAVVGAEENTNTEAVVNEVVVGAEENTVAEVPAEPVAITSAEQQTLMLAAALEQLETALPVIGKADTLAEVMAAPEIYPMRAALDALAANDIALTEVNDLLLHFSTVEAELARPASVNACLIASESSPEELPACGVNRVPLYLEPGTYLNSANGQTVAVTMAAFEDHDTATVMMKQLYTYADTEGQTGNYTLGVTPVDYFYSRLDGAYTFVWSHDNWVYVIAAPTFTDMETLATAFPY